jgi:hypothetical protein
MMREGAVSSSLGSGDAGREDGADFILSGVGATGKAVEHISHERRDGWFRNVHAGHATALGSRR